MTNSNSSGIIDKNANKKEEDMKHKEEKYVDVTDSWIKKSTPNSHKILDKVEYTINGKTYKVDGKKVKLDYSNKEKQIAEILENTFGCEIYMVPRISFTQGISPPDYLFKDKKFDLKEPLGKSKAVLYNMLSKKSKQSPNFIFDISKCPLDNEELIKQAKDIYKSSHTKFVDTIILIKDSKVLIVLERKIKK